MGGGRWTPGQWSVPPGGPILFGQWPKANVGPMPKKRVGRSLKFWEQDGIKKNNEPN